MDGALPLAFELTSLIVLVVILIADLLLVVWRPHVPSMRESALWVTGYAVLAVIFGGLIFAIGDAQHATEFFAGWLTEYSLSIDNLFVFVILMSRFAVPRKYQQEVLMVGIIMALVLRGIFIAVGAALIATFSWIFWIFGAFLIYTAFHQAFRSHDDEEETENKLIAALRKRVTMSPVYDGAKIRTTYQGKRMFTPMLVVFAAIAITDTIFAFDSITAIFGITTSPFIVFTANVFALMGLRQLYFLLGGLLERLEYLKYGIAFILAFIGVKLVLHALHENTLPFINGGHHVEWAPDIPTWLSLLVIVLSMTVATVASLVKLRRPSATEQAEPK
jgi:tellurite resistance protein TerC